MPDDILHFKWEWNLNAPPDQLWPLLSDTNRFNQDAGLPSVEAAGVDPVSKNKKLRAQAAGMLLEWEEKPFEWIAPFEFGVERLFKSGPILSTKIKVKLLPQKGTRIIYESWVTPRNVLARTAVFAQMSWKIRPAIENLLRAYDVRLASPQNEAPKISQPLNNTELNRFSRISPAAAALAVHIETASDLELVRIRPYELAQKHGLARRQMLETFLAAAHQTLLEFQWEIICPHCRGSEKRGPSMEIISQEGYCESCDLHYTVNFDQLVELTFRPNPRIRKISAAFFCTGGPKITPHIVVQKTVNAGESAKFQLSLEPGLYRLRGVRTPKEKIFNVQETGSKTPGFKINGEISGPSEISPAVSEWTVVNESTALVLIALEQMKWAENRVTGRDVMHMRLFRELFQVQCLRPNQPIASGEVTIAFTDLRGSTKMYQEIGDSTAFCQVLNHFDILQDIVAAHDGTVIKTIGDSVMAVFDSPAKALLAMASAQAALAKPAQKKQNPLYLKVGIHKGPNLVVNLNNRLDYFGSSVNIAARLVSLSSGEDIIISSEMAEDPEADIFLHNPQSGFQIEKIQTTIKGFGKENFTLFRLVLK